MAALGDGPVAIVGLGVIGGSLAKALIRTGTAVRAYTPSAADASEARHAGIDVAPDLDDCLVDARAVVIAVPLSAQLSVVTAVASAAAPDATLLHVGSLQRAEAIAGASHADRVSPDLLNRVVGTHPLAGSHRTGFAAADVDLFRGCIVSIEDRADPDTRTDAERIWRAAGADRFEYRSADEHDHLMTWISHLPQLASTAVADAIAAAGVPAAALGPGGRDVTRLASSSFEIWSGILAGAGVDAVRAAAALERSAGALRSALERADIAAVERIWSAARSWREGSPAAAAVVDTASDPPAR